MSPEQGDVIRCNKCGRMYSIHSQHLCPKDKELPPRREPHELKTWPKYFQDVWDGKKNFEIRKNDRDFKVGDVVRLSEYDPITKVYTGRHVVKIITYMTDFGQPEGQVVFGMGAAGMHYE